MSRILVVGSINMDLIIHTPRLPALGETLTGDGFRTIPGGKGANQAAAAARLGAQVHMIGCVGNDVFGGALTASLTDAGVDAAGVERAGEASGIAVITVCGGDNHIILDRGANAMVSPSLLERHRALFQWAELVLLQLEIPMESVLCAAQMAKAGGAAVLLNPAPFDPLPPELLHCVDILVPNASEASLMLGRDITGPAQAAGAVRDLCAHGIRQAAVTIGSSGCVYNDGDTVWHQGAYRVQAVDTTAAGDAFVGGLAVRLGSGACIGDAIAYATAMSAITVGRHGASSSLPDREETDAFYRGHPLPGRAQLL